MKRSNQRATSQKLTFSAPAAAASGMRKQGISSDHWIDAFYYWLEAQGLTRPAAR
jgi:hypothetical protein